MDKNYIDKMKQSYIKKMKEVNERINYLFKYLNENMPKSSLFFFDKNFLDRLEIAQAYYNNGSDDAMCFIPSSRGLSIPDDCVSAIEELRKLMKENSHTNKPVPENIFDYLLDSEPKAFKGDIVITDPCYLLVDKNIDYSTMPEAKDYFSHKNMKEYPDFTTKKSKGSSAECNIIEAIDAICDEMSEKETGFSETYNNEKKAFDLAMNKWRKENRDDWEYCDYGQNMSVLGINNYICRDTIYGDWSCSVFNSDSKEKIGDFCADAGLVCVCQLDEVLRYNPSFKEWQNTHDWCATIIKDFEGTVYFKVVKADDEYEVQVIGNGKNIKTGEPINFISTQTGF